MRRVLLFFLIAMWTVGAFAQSTNLAPQALTSSNLQKTKVLSNYNEDKNYDPKNVSVDSKLILNYEFEQVSGTFISISTTGDTIIPSGWDDGYFYLDLTGNFRFFYNGFYYSSFSVGTNGAIIIGKDLYPSLSNDLSNLTYTPVLAPYWDDMRFYDEGNGDGLFYQIDIQGSDTILTIEWNNVCSYGDEGYPVSYQVKMHSDGLIEFVYGDMSNAAGWESSTGSIGINDNEGGDFASFLSITPGNPATGSYSDANNNIPGADLATYIPSGTIYRFTPVFYDDDMVVIKILPTQGIPDSTINFQVVISNSGLDSATNFTIDLNVVDENANVVYTNSVNYTDVIHYAERDTVDLGTWSTSEMGTYTVTATINYSADQNTNNNTLSQSLPIYSIYLMQNGTDTLCSVLFYDSGGPDGEYQNDENYVLTLYPSEAGKYLQIQFFNVSIENGFDYLIIYNGTSTSDDPLAIITGYSTPTEIYQAKNPEGALTFQFSSDGSVSRDGWEAFISCYTPPQHDLEVTKFVPNFFFEGETINFNVLLTNNGLNDESGFQVHVWDAAGTYDEIVTVSDTISAWDTLWIQMPEWTPTADTNLVYAAVILTGDEVSTNDTIMQIVTKVVPVYAWDAYAASGQVLEGSVIIDFLSGSLYQIGTYDADFIAGSDWTNWGWMGLFYNSKELVLIDPETGNFSSIAQLSSLTYPTGIAFDANNNILYIVDVDDNNTSWLSTFDFATGDVNTIGSIGDYIIIGIAVDNDGNIWGIDLSNDNLVSIDPNTGAGTVVGPLGIDLNYAQDLGYDRENDVLYGALYTSSGSFSVIDTTTGTATEIYNLGDEITGLAFKYQATEYNLTVHVVSAAKGNIPDANVQIKFGSSVYATGTTDADGLVNFSLVEGAYGLVVEANGYVPYNGSFTITNDTTIEVVLETQKVVNVHVEDVDGNAIENANVALGSNTGTTDANGDVSFTVDPGEYTLNVSANGFVSYSTNVNIVNDTTINVVLETQKVVTFHVTNENGDNVQNATIIMSNSNAITDENGMASFTVDPGTYSYVITANGYNTYNGSVEVTQDTTVEVVLTATFVEANSKFAIYPNPVSKSFFVNNAQGYTLEIVSYDGKVLLRETITNSTQEINVEGLQSGSYIVRFKDGDKVINGMIIKQ